MKLVLCLLIALAALLPASAGERVILYARLTEGLLVELTDGSKWQMDKGDCFPVVAYKEAHTKLILQLAGAQFKVPSAKTQIVADKEVPQAIEKYRANVNTYLAHYANQWKDKAAPDPKKEGAGEPKPDGAPEPKKDSAPEPKKDGASEPKKTE